MSFYKGWSECLNVEFAMRKLHAICSSTICHPWPVDWLWKLERALPGVVLSLIKSKRYPVVLKDTASLKGNTKIQSMLLGMSLFTLHAYNSMPGCSQLSQQTLS